MDVRIVPSKRSKNFRVYAEHLSSIPEKDIPYENAVSVLVGDRSYFYKRPGDTQREKFRLPKPQPKKESWSDLIG